MTRADWLLALVVAVLTWGLFAAISREGREWNAWAIAHHCEQTGGKHWRGSTVIAQGDGSVILIDDGDAHEWRCDGGVRVWR